MASSRKPRSAESVVVGLSGGVDSVVLLHLLRHTSTFRLRAVHIHHGLSPNADAWADFCRELCRRWKVPLSVRGVAVRHAGKGLEAAARAARYEVFRKLDCDAIALAHQLDDQAETVLLNLLRGAGPRGAAGMPPRMKFGDKELIRPLLDTPREAILAYARAHRLQWIEDESNADESLTRNFIRRRVGPLLADRFPAWRQNLARAARLLGKTDGKAEALLRTFLRSKGLKAPSEAKLLEMLKQLGAGRAGTRIEHDGAVLRVYRGKIFIADERRSARAFSPIAWRGERRLPLPELGGELRFRQVRGKGIDPRHKSLKVRLRGGGERLQPDARRPRRTLKNLFQEAGVPRWERDRLPLLYCGDELVWVPGIGVDARYRVAPSASGLLPEWHRVGA
jgi:tRNA(Ile)-lysidine synthase